MEEWHKALTEHNEKVRKLEEYFETELIHKKVADDEFTTYAKREGVFA